MNLPEAKFRNKVHKSKVENYTLEFIGIQSFKVIQNEKLKWKLTNDKKKIQSYICQKAYVNFGNRE